MLDSADIFPSVALFRYRTRGFDITTLDAFLSVRDPRTAGQQHCLTLSALWHCASFPRTSGTAVDTLPADCPLRRSHRQTSSGCSSYAIRFVHWTCSPASQTADHEAVEVTSCADTSRGLRESLVRCAYLFRCSLLVRRALTWLLQRGGVRIGLARTSQT